MTFSQNDEKLNGEVSMRSAKMKFDGTLLKGKAHGKGDFSVSKGVFSETELISKRDSYVYSGEFKDGKPNGRGSLYLLNGDMYFGNFKNGFPHGEGAYLWLLGEETHSFRGTFKDGHIQDGEAELVSDDMVYQGYFKNAKFHGKGILSLKFDSKGKKKTIYEGLWENNHLVHARVKYYKDGKFDVYEGGFTSGVRFDKRHGKGSTYNFANGEYCVCEFVNDVQMGYAEMTSVNGDKYKGQMKDFVREGYGEFYQNGRVYKGVWKNNHIIEGKLEYAHDVFEGQLKDGKRHGIQRSNERLCTRRLWRILPERPRL